MIVDAIEARTVRRATRSGRGAIGAAHRSRLTRLTGLVVLVVLAGCSTHVGGWDVAALLRAEPDLAAIEGQRLGDMTPYPALVDGRLLLVVCRFEADRPVRVWGSGFGYSAERAAAAVRAVSRGAHGVAITLQPDDDPPEGDRVDSIGGAGGEPVEIVIEMVGAARGTGPAGLADTLAECDVGARFGADGRTLGVRGRLQSAHIRLRRARRDAAGRLWAAKDEEWVGALAHELAHALGFAGHARRGSSLVVLDQQVLRGIGRRALAGEAIAAPNLAALYRLDPGRILGEVRVRDQDRALLASVAALVGLGSDPSLAAIASVGDRAARIVWRLPSRAPLELRFPYWARELRAGQPVSIVPSAATLHAIASEAQAVPNDAIALP